MAQHDRRLAALAGVCIFLMFSSAAPSAQEYFGRNKVQYKQLDFQVLKTDHFDIYFYPERA